MARFALLLLSLLPLVAGCVAPVTFEPKAALLSLDEAEAGSAFAYECPPGGKQRADGLCVSSISDATASEQEPFLAVNPLNPDVIVLGTNRGDVAQPASLLQGEVSTPPVELVLRVSTNGGGTWTRVPLPALAQPKLGGLPARANLDPTLAFDSTGTLHVAAVVLGASPGGEDLDVYYAATPDLGATWQNVQIVTTDGSNDRPWLTVLPDDVVYVTTHGSGSGGIYWSEDGGATWRATDRAATLPGCTPPGPMIDVRGTPTVACVTQSSLLGGLARVYAFDPETGTTEQLAQVRVGGSEPFLVLPKDGPLVLQVEQIVVADTAGAKVENSTIWLATSGDGGRTWSSFVNGRDLVSVEDLWASVQGYWIEADPWGNVHLILQGCRNYPPALPAQPSACPGALGTQEFAHVVLDPASLTLVQERALTSPSPVDHALSPVGGGAGVGDHFGGIAFGDSYGVLAWTRYSPPGSYASARTGPGISVDYTMVRPES